MQERLKRYALVLCLFVFLFVTLGAGFHLNSAGAFVAALSGTPLVVHAFNRWSEPSQRIGGQRTRSSCGTQNAAPDGEQNDSRS